VKVDFHSHVLPGIDDGAKDIGEALEMLKMLKGDGVETVVATPHFYIHKQNIDEFLEKREKSAAELREAMQGESYPNIVLGAEVYFGSSLSTMPVESLCISGTDYILLELPYNPFSRTFLNLLADFVGGGYANVILAHVERYFDNNDEKIIEEILSYGVLAQVNCESIISQRSRRLCLKLIDRGLVTLIGTDAHSVKRRLPEFAKAEKIIRRKLSDECFENLMVTAGGIIG
jgi:protein-tyrosine phosphatase